MTVLEIKKILVDATKGEQNITEEMIDNVIASNDINSLIEQTKALFTFEVWDKRSKINNAEASVVLKQMPFTLPNWNGMSYFIKSQDKIRYFETSDWEKGGWTPILTEDRVIELVEKQISNLAIDGTIYVLLKNLRGEQLCQN